jgi:hypothetical protein
VEEVVALLAGNFEVDETEVLSRNNGLLTLVTDNDRSKFHSSPLELCLLPLVGKARFAMSLDLYWLPRTCRPPISRAREEHFNHPTLRMREFAARRERPGSYWSLRKK